MDKIKIDNLTDQFKNISQWSLGTRLLNRVINDKNILNPKRTNRSVIFFDIRGFTTWSENHHPEEVVVLLNNFYKSAESVLDEFQAIMSKYTADEIMVVFENVKDAVDFAEKLNFTLNHYLENFNLKAGGGVHCGPVVEGLIGGHVRKLFDVMGDTVNTAKRLCETALGTEVLISQSVFEITKESIQVINHDPVSLKGKSSVQNVYLLRTSKL